MYRENKDPPEVKLGSIIGLLVEGVGLSIGTTGVLTTVLALGACTVLCPPLW